MVLKRSFFFFHSLLVFWKAQKSINFLEIYNVCDNDLAVLNNLEWHFVPFEHFKWFVSIMPTKRKRCRASVNQLKDLILKRIGRLIVWMFMKFKLGNQSIDVLEFKIMISNTHLPTFVLFLSFFLNI